MKKSILMLAFMSFVAFNATAANVNGVPFKDHHAKMIGSAMTCKTCHGVDLPTHAPESGSGCVACHGTMDKIPTKPNRFDKYPHASEHYGNTLECVACHAEHKPSKALCNDCHTVEWTNFK